MSFEDEHGLGDKDKKIITKKPKKTFAGMLASAKKVSMSMEKK